MVDESRGSYHGQCPEQRISDLDLVSYINQSGMSVLLRTVVFQ